MSDTVSITELAKTIRSKNAKAFELTLDIVFKDRETYQWVKETGVITKELIADLYKVPLGKIIAFIYYDAGNAIKATLRRPIVGGGIGDTDAHGCQQHAPLLDIRIPRKQSSPHSDAS